MTFKITDINVLIKECSNQKTMCLEIINAGNVRFYVKY